MNETTPLMVKEGITRRYLNPENFKSTCDRKSKWAKYRICLKFGESVTVVLTNSQHSRIMSSALSPFIKSIHEVGHVKPKGRMTRVYFPVVLRNGKTFRVPNDNIYHESYQDAIIEASIYAEVNNYKDFGASSRRIYITSKSAIVE